MARLWYRRYSTEGPRIHKNQLGAAPEHWTVRVRSHLATIGLNVGSTIDGTPYESFLAGCRSILVFASGGPFLWEAFMCDLRDNPDHLRQSEHPLDDFVKRQIEAVDPNPDASRRWIRCAAQPEAFLDFRPLAVRGSIGWASRLGLILNPKYGPWIALRAACLTTETLNFDDPLLGAGPCEQCPAPCISACPGNALSSGTMNIQRCAAFHSESPICTRKCDARLVCPQGADFRYSPSELHYHYSRSSGRAQLTRLLGIEDDRRIGRDPDWVRWAQSRDERERL